MKKFSSEFSRREFIKASGGLAFSLAVAGPGLTTPAQDSAAAPMPKRILGKTNVEVSALALGGVIGMQKPPSADHDPVAIAETALNLGITYFDTAPSYNNGQSESNYGHIIERRRKEVFLATKTGDRTYDGTMRSIEQSLKRLRTDHVDLIQIHGVATNEKLEDWEKDTGVLSALRKLRDQKVTRFFGVTGHETAERLRQAVEMFQLDTLLTTLNPVPRRKPFRNELLSAANRKNMGVIAMKVIGGGNGCLAKGNPFQNVIFPYHDQTPHQVDASLLISYVLGLPISVAVIGVDSIEELKANIATVKNCKPMSANQQRELEQSMAVV